MPSVSEDGANWEGIVFVYDQGSLPPKRVKKRTQLTGKELGISSLGHLHTTHRPRVENLRLHDWRIHEVTVRVA